MRVFDARLIDETIAAARARERRRANLNVHLELDDPIQRMFNVLEPGSYVRPHCHEPERWEVFTILAGKAAAITFKTTGEIEGHAVIAPGVAWAVEIPGGTWHTILALAADTVLFEVKPGPFRPLIESDFAPWAPAEGTPEAAATLTGWREFVLSKE
jgi:cupin fold WbuC family metalloprotein